MERLPPMSLTRMCSQTLSVKMYGAEQYHSDHSPVLREGLDVSWGHY